MTDKVIETIRDVYKTLGSGLTESIYQKALIIGLKHDFESVESEWSVPIIYRSHEIAVCRADIVIDNVFILELKAVTKLTQKGEVQIQRYMKILGIDRGILANFGKELEIKEIARSSIDGRTN